MIRRSDSNNDFFGLLCIVFGSVVLLYAIGAFIFRIIVAFLAFLLINYGLRLRHMPPLHVSAFSFFFGKRWF